MSLRTMEISYPEELPAALGETQEEFEREMKFLVAARMYELGRISSGRAAVLAGMNRPTFLQRLGRYRVSVFNYQAEELDQEIREARARHENLLKVVSNTSPLILLGKIGRLGLLRQLYAEVLVAGAVYDEIREKSTGETQAIEDLVRSKELCLRNPGLERVAGVSADLGKGERETIALAVESVAGLVIMDDREGRRIARLSGLSVTGTIGVLVEAREKRLISSIRSKLDRLIEAGVWLDEAFYARVLREYDE